MRLAVLLTVAAIGCGTSGAMSPLVEAGPSDAATVYCSSQCGKADAGVDGAIQCSPGEICGQTGGVSGFICCNAEAGACSPGNPAPNTPGCQ